MTNYAFLSNENYSFENSRIRAGYTELYLSSTQDTESSAFISTVLAIYPNGSVISEVMGSADDGIYIILLWGTVESFEIEFAGGRYSIIDDGHSDFENLAVQEIQEFISCELNENYFVLYIETEGAYYALNVDYHTDTPDTGSVIYNEALGISYCPVGGTSDDIVMDTITLVSLWVFDDLPQDLGDAIVYPTTFGNNVDGVLIMSSPDYSTIVDFGSSQEGEKNYTYYYKGIEFTLTVYFFEELPSQDIFASGSIVLELNQEITVQDIQNLEIYVRYITNNDERIPLALDMLSGIDTSKVGKFTATVTYRGQTTLIDYYVNDSENLAVVGIENYTNYNSSLYVSQSGQVSGTITVYFSDGTSKIITSTDLADPNAIDMEAAILDGSLTITEIVSITGITKVRVSYLSYSCYLDAYIYDPQNPQILYELKTWDSEEEEYINKDKIIGINENGEPVILGTINGGWYLDNGQFLGDYGGNNMPIPQGFYIGLDLNITGWQTVYIYTSYGVNSLIVYVYHEQAPLLNVQISVSQYIAKDSQTLPGSPKILYYADQNYSNEPGDMQDLTIDMIEDLDTSVVGWQKVKVYIDILEDYKSFWIYVYETDSVPVLEYRLKPIPDYINQGEEEEILECKLFVVVFVDGTSLEIALNDDTTPYLVGVTVNNVGGQLGIHIETNNSFVVSGPPGHISETFEFSVSINVRIIYTTVYSEEYSGYIISSYSNEGGDSVKIPSELEGQSVVRIGNYAFSNGTFTSITIPDSVLYMGEGAFDNCSEDLIIYVAFSSEPDGWDINWNPQNRRVFWGYTGETVTYSFVTNEGSAVESISAVFLNEAPVTTKTGYEFGGWYDNQQLSGLAVTFPYYSNTNITLYAKWIEEQAPITYIITFETNGAGEIADATVNEGETLSEPAVPTKSGYTFGGWYLDNNTFANEYDFDTAVTESFTLYAKWSELSLEGTSFDNAFIAEVDIPVNANIITMDRQKVYYVFVPDESGYYEISCEYIPYSMISWNIYNSQYVLIKTKNTPVQFSFNDGETYYIVLSVINFGQTPIGNVTFEISGIDSPFVSAIPATIDTIYQFDEEVPQKCYTFTLAESGEYILLFENCNGYLHNSNGIFIDGNSGSMVVELQADTIYYMIVEIYNFIETIQFYKFSITEYVETELDSMWEENQELFYEIWGIFFIEAYSDMPVQVNFNFTYNYNGIGIKVLSLMDLPVAIEFATEADLNASIATLNDEIIDEPEVFEYKKIAGYNILVLDYLGLPFILTGNVVKNGDAYFDSDNKILIRYLGTATEYTIPYGVTTIGMGVFALNNTLTTIIIPNSVTSISFEAFAGCTSLTSITIPDSVTSIGEGAFFYCSGLTSITIPDSVTSIGEGAFGGCSGLTIYAEASTKPGGWNNNWNSSNRPVVWGYTEPNDAAYQPIKTMSYTDADPNH